MAKFVKAEINNLYYEVLGSKYGIEGYFLPGDEEVILRYGKKGDLRVITGVSAESMFLNHYELAASWEGFFVKEYLVPEPETATGSKKRYVIDLEKALASKNVKYVGAPRQDAKKKQIQKGKRTGQKKTTRIDFEDTGKMWIEEFSETGILYRKDRKKWFLRAVFQKPYVLDKCSIFEIRDIDSENHDLVAMVHRLLTEDKEQIKLLDLLKAIYPGGSSRIDWAFGSAQFYNAFSSTFLVEMTLLFASDDPSEDLLVPNIMWKIGEKNEETYLGIVSKIMKAQSSQEVRNIAAKALMLGFEISGI